MKVKRIEFPWGEVHLEFKCPGCKCTHVVRIVARGGGTAGCWTYNDDPEAPTIRASVLVDKDRPERTCHFHVTDGKIEYLPDCHHELAGQTVAMENIE